jgi:class 3 adenylate cyclase
VPPVQTGAQRRGTGETIRAVLLSADLRDFTALSETTKPAALDAWFDRVAEAVHAFGGEVLKFIGDGVLGDLPGRRLAGPTGWTSPPRSVPRSTWSAGSRGCADRSAGRC